MITIDFYFWNHQCPYNCEIINMLCFLQHNSDYIINFYDVSMDHSIAEEINMYSPTLLIFNKKIRWNGPISLNIIHSIAEGNLPKRQPYSMPLGTKEFNGTLKYLTENTASDIYPCCAPGGDQSFCTDKAEWISAIKKKYSMPYLGILHYSDKCCVGGAEFVPSLEAPYSIPKDMDIAFLTCSYLSNERLDYRSKPLRRLETVLPSLGFTKLEAIASEAVLFPNGTLQWFLGRGYKDLGQIYYEKESYALMHIVGKNL